MLVDDISETWPANTHHAVILTAWCDLQLMICHEFDLSLCIFFSLFIACICSVWKALTFLVDHLSLPFTGPTEWHSFILHIPQRVALGAEQELYSSALNKTTTTTLCQPFLTGISSCPLTAVMINMWLWQRGTPSLAYCCELKLWLYLCHISNRGTRGTLVCVHLQVSLWSPLPGPPARLTGGGWDPHPEITAHFGAWINTDPFTSCVVCTEVICFSLFWQNDD